VSSLTGAVTHFYEQELASGRKRFLRDEPATNRDGLRTFDFYDYPYNPASISDVRIRNAMVNEFRNYLTGPGLSVNDRFTQNEFNTVLGNLNNPVTARFFVIHDRAADNVPFNPANINADGRGVHLWMDHRSNYFLQRDYDQPGHATKFEQTLTNMRDPRFFQNNLWPAGTSSFQTRGVQHNDFIHVEMTATTNGDRIRANTALAPGYTRKQVLVLALAYISASLRRGAFLTVTAHREVDRGINSINGNRFRWGHDDPRNFDIITFYRSVNEIYFQYGFGTGASNVGFTFGIDAARMNIDRAGNRSDSLHTFPNQYGPRVNKPNNWNNAGTIRINCGGMNLTIRNPIIPNPANPAVQLRRGEAYVFACGAPNGGPFLQP
jgi:hypothetical protein